LTEGRVIKGVTDWHYTDGSYESKITLKYARDSHAVVLPPWREGQWLKTMLLHTICNVISVKLLMINNS